MGYRKKLDKKRAKVAKRVRRAREKYERLVAFAQELREKSLDLRGKNPKARGR